MAHARDSRRLNDAPARARPERDAEGRRRRREQSRDQRASCDSDHQQQRGNHTLFPAHVVPLSRRQLPQGTIGRRGDWLEIRGVKLSSFKLKLVAYFVLLSLVPLAATYWGFSTVAGAGESRQVTLRQEAGLRAALALYAEQADRAQARAEQLARSRPLQRALERRDRRALQRIVAGRPSLYVVGRRRPPRRHGAAARRPVPRRRRRRRASPGRGRGDGPARCRARRASPAGRGVRLRRRARPARGIADRGVDAATPRTRHGAGRTERDRQRRRHALPRLRRAVAAASADGAARRPDPDRL